MNATSISTAAPRHVATPWKSSRPGADWEDTSGGTCDVTYAKTNLGHQVVRDRSVRLTPRQRALLILVDGHRSLEELLAATAIAGVTLEDVDVLGANGLIEDPTPELTARHEAQAAKRAAAVLQHRNRSPQECFLEAYPIASHLTADLGLRGIRLHLAVEAAATYQDLIALAPKIRDTVGVERYAPLADALSTN